MDFIIFFYLCKEIKPLKDSIIMKLSLSLFLLSICFSSVVIAQPRIVAHRGYWKTDGSAQNSLTALQKSADTGLYGSEFDVWITADGVPVVFHDAVWDGKRIDESTYPELMSRRLPNGEFLPTLQQYLQLGKKLPYTKLILEIKSHKNDERNLKIVQKCVELVRELQLEKQVEYIAFSRYVCEQLIALSPNSKVAYLNGDIEPAQIKKMGLTGIDYHHSVFKKNPKWLKQAKKRELEVNVWTVNGKEALEEFAKMEGIDLITTDEPTVLQEIIK